jgi:hypothetical protein
MKTEQELEQELDRYQTNKILSGQGLQDDPVWVKVYRDILEIDEYGFRR